MCMCIHKPPQEAASVPSPYFLLSLSIISINHFLLHFNEVQGYIHSIYLKREFPPPVEKAQRTPF